MQMLGCFGVPWTVGTMFPGKVVFLVQMVWLV